MRLSRILVCFVLAMLVASCASRRHEGIDVSRAMIVKDKAFRQYLLDRGYAVCVGNGLTQRRLMAPTPVGSKIGEMNCYRRGIRSLEGIAMFSQLNELVCSENPINGLDLSGLPNLVTLTALEVPLQYIDISLCSKLQTVELSEHKLTDIDLSHNSELTSLMCIFNPAITDIDVSHNSKLQTLYVRATNIRILDLSNNAFMHRVFATDTPIDTVWLSPEQDVGDLEVWVDDTIAILKRDR